jgi:hypothetical protein
MLDATTKFIGAGLGSWLYQTIFIRVTKSQLSGQYNIQASMVFSLCVSKIYIKIQTINSGPLCTLSRQGKIEGQRTYKLTLRHVHETVVAIEKQCLIYSGTSNYGHSN